MQKTNTLIINNISLHYRKKRSRFSLKRKKTHRGANKIKTIQVQTNQEEMLILRENTKSSSYKVIS